MTIRLLLTPAVALVLGVGLAACGGSESASPPPSPPSEPSGPDDVLTIEEALASNPQGPVTVTGFLLVERDGPVRLCSALAESYPPQCGGASLVVEGLDLATVDGLTTPEDPEFAHTSWTDQPITLEGTLSDGVITVGES